VLKTLIVIKLGEHLKIRPSCFSVPKYGPKAFSKCNCIYVLLFAYFYPNAVWMLVLAPFQGGSWLNAM